MVDVMWVLICAFLVFLMQLGFTALEAGMTRAKNAINVAMKNISDFMVSTMIFWLLGFGIMFGATRDGWFGTSYFAHDWSFESVDRTAHFVFQAMFCATAATLTSGAVAERMRFFAFLAMTALIAMVIYPVFGHWTWYQDITGGQGWLRALGFVDFAGATVVHALGGWVALAAVIVTGPRIGRFDEKGKPRQITGSNLAVAAIGMVAIWIGWFGFNGGSVAGVNKGTAAVILNTLLAGAAAGVATVTIVRLLRLAISPYFVINGCLAGLVSITACANMVSSLHAVVIGALGATVMLVAHNLLLRAKIDDAVGAVPVHLAGGIWGTIAVALFSDAGRIGTGLDFWSQLQAQVVGIVACGIWAFPVTYLFLKLLNHLTPVRISPEGEFKGLNVSEHGATTELLDLVASLDDIAHSQDITKRAPVEPFTEVGVIAEKYNSVMDRLESTVAKTESIVKSVREAIVTYSRDELEIISINPAGAALLGIAADRAVGLPLSKIVEVSDERGKPLSLRYLITETLVHGERDIRMQCHGDRQIHDLHWSVAEVDLGGNKVYTSVLHDISERKGMERALKEAKEEAERAFEQLQAAQEGLIQTEKMAALGGLVAGVAHEINTPVGMAVSVASHLQDKTEQLAKAMEGGKIKKADFDSYLETARTSSDILLKNALRAADLIQNFKQVAVDQTSDMRRNFDLRTNLEETLVSLQPKVKKSSVEVRLDCPAGIEMDSYPGAISQVITNLVMNSLTHAYGEGQPGVIRIEVTSRDDGKAVVTYSDDGRGIDEEHRGRIFDPFYTTKRSKGGTGLGLHIVYNLITSKLLGEISFSSVSGEGTRFVMTIPLKVLEDHNHSPELAPQQV